MNIGAAGGEEVFGQAGVSGHYDFRIGIVVSRIDAQYLLKAQVFPEIKKGFIRTHNDHSAVDGADGSAGDNVDRNIHLQQSLPDA
ncbi:hypothetical protein SDC9_169997 [bioreactor metagenome]|uniref:Uncharacterized protein n=1 Tax=bioreactor metagenome TaxID=1076179 RepID=A0A645GF56_9ZZZZ